MVSTHAKMLGCLLAVIAACISTASTLRFDDEICLLQNAVDGKRRGSHRFDQDQVELANLSRFETSYEWSFGSGSDASTHDLDIKGFHPDPAGRFPVYVYLSGTLDVFASPQDMNFVELMARKGFTAATIQYENGAFCPVACMDEGQCKGWHPQHETILEKAKKIRSALHVLCASDRADCAKGLALHGHSLGAFVAMDLTSLDERVSALVAMGVGVFSGGKWNNTCLLDKALSSHLPKCKRRYVDGAADTYFTRHHQALQSYSGYHCGNAVAPVNCIQEDGSGYYIVAKSQYAHADKKMERDAGDIVHSHVAGHNFFGSTDPVTKSSVLLPSFAEGSAPWCMKPNLDWLAAAATSRDCLKAATTSGSKHGET